MKRRAWTLTLVAGLLGITSAARAASAVVDQANTALRAGQNFKAARLAFTGENVDADASAIIALGLVRAGLPHSASYFFIKTLQSGNRTAIRKVLSETPALMLEVGPDLIRKYLVKNTKFEDYDSVSRSAFLYAQGKEAVLTNQADKAIDFFGQMSSQSRLWPYALQLRGTAYALTNRNELALQDFKACQRQASRVSTSASSAREADDLEARCQAGEARTLYQMNKFEDAEYVYDRIPKSSFVWPDILFEQAWNAFAQDEYNRTLGKLVSYQSPALSFVYNSEVDVLRAQSYLALCLYSDANKSISDFNLKYSKLGEEVKRFVEHNSGNLDAFYQLGTDALHAPLYTTNDVYRMANRFVRGPYFQKIAGGEKALNRELVMIRQFDQREGGQFSAGGTGKGFPGFLQQTLRWRLKTLKSLGGAFVKNSLIDYHGALIADFEKMSFIKLEMLKRAKETLMTKRPYGEGRLRGNREPGRRDYQFYWSFNGEFWTDELGDYVFGLDSECSKGASS